MRNAVWIALVVIGLAVIAWWMWVYRAPPAVPAESGGESYLLNPQGEQIGH